MIKRKVNSAALSGSITLIVLGILVFLREFVKFFNQFLTSLTGHHWVSKSLITTFLFIILFVIFSKISLFDKYEPHRSMSLLIASTIVSFGIISLTYIIHFIK